MIWCDLYFMIILASVRRLDCLGAKVEEQLVIRDDKALWLRKGSGVEMEIIVKFAILFFEAKLEEYSDPLYVKFVLLSSLNN